jgi:inorganic pyrophosphatase
MWIKKKNFKIDLNCVSVKKDEDEIYFYHNYTKISPWHDINLKHDDHHYNMITEIPKWTRAKMEIELNKEFNPIKQDIEEGRPREYKWGDMMFNYGVLPQTWENPNIIYKQTGKKGDGDPLDIIDIGVLQKQIGSIYPVKILGVLPMIDQGETDWKIISICVKDPMAPKLNDLSDIKKYIPGLLSAIKLWFRKYKLPTKGIENKFSGDYEDKEYAISVIEEANEHYLNLLS